MVKRIKKLKKIRIHREGTNALLYSLFALVAVAVVLWRSFDSWIPFAAFVLVFGLAWLLVLTVGITNIFGLLVFTLLWGLQGGISVQSFYALWASELFPAKYRAAAQGVMFFIVRGLSAAWGLGFVYIYGENGEGFTIAGFVMMALLLVSLVIGTAGAPNTRGKTLEQITKERYG